MVERNLVELTRIFAFYLGKSTYDSLSHLKIKCSLTVDWIGKILIKFMTETLCGT